MPTSSIQEFCNNVRHNKFGGAAEMVDAAVEAFADSAHTSPASTPQDFARKTEEEVDAVLGVIPSIAPMINLLHQVMSTVEAIHQEDVTLDVARDKVASTAEQYQQRQIRALSEIGRIGSQLISDGDKIGTYSTSGTVMGILKAARADGKAFTAVVTESRPANEGLRTLREISELGVPVTLGIDAALGVLMNGCALAVVGADVITSTGQVLAKVGTYLQTLVAREYNIPFYVACDTSKFDPMTLDGFPVKIRDKGVAMVTTEPLPETSRVLNPTFELVPAHLVTGIITEQGIIHPGTVATVMRDANLSPRLVEKLRAWVQVPTPST